MNTSLKAADRCIAVTDQRSKKTILVLSQVYVPDPASVGQHMHDAAAELALRGFGVRVLASANGYDDPKVEYPIHETRDGVTIRRLPWSSFGKKSIALRLLGGFLFMFQSIFRGLFTPGLSAILVSTSPPMCAAAAMFIAFFRRVPIKYWVMDLNPDQMVELGKLKPDAFLVRTYDWFNRLILSQASDVVALDRFMAARLTKKRDVSAKMKIMPPWPHDGHLEVVKHENNPFRKQHGLDGKFVIMYSGNHALSNPITTILDAALKMQDQTDVVFMFIGGGIGKKEVEKAIADHKPKNIISLPYQPLDTIKYSLSAADVHIVSIGNGLVGVVHPCKVYGAMAVQRPILLLGPDPCHVSDLIRDEKIGWLIEHGDVSRALEVIGEIVSTPKGELDAMGSRARELTERELNKRVQCGRFCDVVARGL